MRARDPDRRTANRERDRRRARPASRGGWRRTVLAFAIPAALAVVAACQAASAPEAADVILTGGTIWTGDDQTPRAEAVAVRGSRILAVGSASDVAGLQGPETRMVELDGRFVAPGFIDNHTHFNSAGALLLGANLLDVSDEESLRSRVREAAERLPPGAWMTGGDWGAYEEWEMGGAGPRSGSHSSPSPRIAR